MSDQQVLPESTSTETGLKFAKVLVWLVYAYFLIAIIILVLEFFLLLFNASTDASFTQWVYRNGDRVMEPFRGIFPAETAGNGSVIHGPRLSVNSIFAKGSWLSDLARRSISTRLPGIITGRKCRPRPPAT